MKLSNLSFIAILCSLIFFTSTASANMPGESQEILLARTAEVKATVRSDAANVLKRYGDQQVESRLIELTQDPDWRVRFDAVKTLGRLGSSKSINSITPLVQDSMPHVRMISVWALYQIGDLEAIPTIIEAVKDTDPQVQQITQRVLKNVSETPVERNYQEWKAWWGENEELVAADWEE